MEKASSPRERSSKARHATSTTSCATAAGGTITPAGDTDWNSESKKRRARGRASFESAWERKRGNLDAPYIPARERG